VILSLLTSDGEQVRARASLNADQYDQADKAHMKDGAFVKVKGKLHPGRQPRHLSDIQSFELLTK
jgi:5-carboxymethyl-2-hydroxymuconate isomerase